ncbi:MAG: AMP-binding protein [Pseudomonadota bacterium]
MRIDPLAPPAGTVRDWLDHHAAHQGDRICYLFAETGDRLTWAELRDLAADIAARLTGLGLQPGESIAQMLPNGREAVLCLMGGLYGGFRVTAINLVAGADAIAYALDHSQARFAFVGAAQRPLFDQAGLAAIVALPVDGRVSWPVGSRAGALHDISPGDDALLMYTSGTTGRPKGVVHSQASLLAGGWTTTLAHDLSASDRALCILPVYHINGLCVTVIAPLVSGGSVAMCSRFSASRFWDQMAAMQATWFSAVPTIISHLLHGENGPSAETRARVRFARSASSALAVEVQRAFENRFEIPIVETMGLTETAAQILSNPLPPGLRKIGSPGIAFGNQVAIIGPDLSPLALGETGEIAVSGPNVMREYLKNPEATAETFTPDGWLRTGDLGRQDADGYVFVTGRLKELIIKGGENIAPREIDEVLYSHKQVVEAAAFARPCTRYGERVEAAVRLADGATVTTDELVRICEDRLGSFKCPDMIHVLDELPKGPSGKIQRLKLAELTDA